MKNNWSVSFSDEEVKEIFNECYNNNESIEEINERYREEDLKRIIMDSM